MNVMAAICNSFSGRRSFASLTRSPGLNERVPVEEAGSEGNNVTKISVKNKQKHIINIPDPFDRRVRYVMTDPP